VRPSLPASVAGARIEFALLSIPSLRLPESLGVVTLVSRRLTTAWDPSSATWSYPWHIPGGGGDFDTTDRPFYAASPGDSTPVRLDLTRHVRAWQAGNNFGFILMRPSYEGGGFGSEGALLRKAILKARIKFYYTKIQE
jgi:hypothetical protein